MNEKNILGTEKIGKLLWNFALPSILSMVINALYGVVDRIFVGRGVGTLAIAGVMVSFPIMLILLGFGVLVGFGAANAISIYLGQQKKEEAEKALGNAVIIYLVLALLIGIVGLTFLKPILTVFGASPEVLPYAERFSRIILLGSVFQFLGFGINNIIRAEGNPFYSMITQVTGAVLNAIFGYLFIFVLKMGIAGSATATVSAQAIVSIMVMGYFFNRKSALRFQFKIFKPDLAIIWRILSIGFAQFSIQISISGLLAILNAQLLRYGGNKAISAWGAINGIMLLILMPIFGLNLGAQPIVGYNFGAKNCPRVRQTLMLTILSAALIGFLGLILIQIFSPVIVAAFSKNDPELVAIGAHGMRIFLALLPIVGFQITGSSYFQYIGKPRQSMILGLSRSILLLMPAVIILPLFFGLNGVWLAGPAADSVSSIITGSFIYREFKKLRTTERCPEAQPAG